MGKTKKEDEKITKVVKEVISAYNDEKKYDSLGSYTGSTYDKDKEPVQDADDL